jgi:vacuolar protein sorting-associated protein IST1
LSLQSTEPPPSTVPARVASKLAVYTPARELVDAYLYEIARGYGVNWTPEPAADEPSIDQSLHEKGKGKEDDASDEGPGEGQEKEPSEEAKRDPSPVKVAIADKEEDPKPQTAAAKDAEVESEPKKGTEEEELAKRFERLKNLR